MTACLVRLEIFVRLFVFTNNHSVGNESYGDSAQVSDSMRGLEDDETQQLAESAMRMLALHAREKNEPRVSGVGARERREKLWK